MARVEFIEVTKRYGNSDAGAVSNVNLTVEDEEFLVLLGPSGCGKSTLLKMIAGLEDVTDGEIYIDDRMVNYEHPARRNVAMVFQNYALYPHMTVYDNIGFPLRMTGVGKDETRRKVLNAAQILDLEPYLDRRPEHLSGGQRQRVALGRAIVREPAVFLMDEPLSNLDAQLRAQTRDELLKLQQRLRTTTIYVTHDQIEAMTMGHRIVVMRSGVVQQVGKPQEVYDRPVNTFVAAFLGSPRINLHTGELGSVNGVPAFINPDMTIPLTGPLVKQTKNLAAGSELALGIRAEDIEVGTGPHVISEHVATVPAQVALVESVGSDLYVNATVGESTSFMTRTDPRLIVAVNDQINLEFNLAHAHLFGPDGLNLGVIA